MVRRAGTPRLRRVVVTAAIGLLLPGLMVTTAGATDPPPDPATAPGPTSLVSRSAVGGPRMAETGFVTAPGAPALPATSAASWIVADAGTGEVLAARDPHRPLRPASTIKTLLALTMAPRLDPNGTYTADLEDAGQIGTRVGMVPGQEYRIDDLWYGLLLRSGNDAATGIAKAGGGTLERGIAMMQAEARRLQANDTTVVNPSGLDADGQYASAYDLALWGRAALSRGDLRSYVSTVKHQFPGNQTATATPKNSLPFDVYTENRLMLRGFPGAIGVKMGYTSKAQNTMIAAAERDGRTILAALMLTPGGHVTADAGQLLEYGFATAGTVAPVGQLVEPLSAALVSDLDSELGIEFGGAAVPAGDKGTPALPSSLVQVELIAGQSSLPWTALAGAGILGALLLAGAGRVLLRRHRYARYGAFI